MKDEIRASNEVQVEKESSDVNKRIKQLNGIIGKSDAVVVSFETRCNLCLET
jgi:hypothetical protein